MEFGQHPRGEEKLNFGIGVSVLFWIGLERKKQQTNKLYLEVDHH